MISFLRPLLLLLLLFIPLDIYFQLIWKRRGGKIDFPFHMWSAKPLLPHRGDLILGIVLSSALYWGSLASFIVAFAGPVRIIRQEVYLERGGDIMFVLDESPSMAAKDLQPENRFGAAKLLIHNFVELKTHDHIGLVTFGSEAVLQIPPTTDYKTLLNRVDQLELGDLGTGTAIGTGIGVAVAHLAESRAPFRSVVLLTDGVNNEGRISPALAARAAAASGIKIFTVVLGSPGESGLEYTDPETGEQYSGIAVDTLNTDLLLSIAEVTGGDYMPAPNSALLHRTLQVIGVGDGSANRPTFRFIPYPRNRIWIFLGLTFFAVHLLMRRMVLGELFP